MKTSLHKLLKVFLLLTIYCSMDTVFAQAPQKMSYQAVIRNASNTLVSNTAVRVRVSILQTTATGTVVYSETHQPTTNTNGLATFEIGGGTIVSGNFAIINWANGPYFIKTETDPTGGTNYTISGTNQLLSVPFALYAANSGSSSSNWTTTGTNIANNNTGNVGIGTGATLPSSLLTVKKDGIGFTQEDPTGVSKVGFYTASTGAWLQTHSDTDLSFSTNDGATQMRLQKTTGNLGIGVPIPTEKLDVNGKTKTTNLQVTTGAGTGKVLTSDALGNASWQTNNSWQTTGNSGTNSTVNFIGTTDNVDLIFKRQNIISGKIQESNTSFGVNSLRNSGTSNTAFGAYSQNQISTSNSNTSVGASALESNFFGSENTAIGTRAMQGNINESNNVAVGFESLYSNAGGSGTAIGSKSLRSNTTGDLNVALGANALFANTVGYENTAIGSSAADSNVSGINNVAVGISAFGSNVSGSFNTAIGSYAYNNSGGSDNSTAIGYNSVITSSNQVRIGNAAVSSIGGFASWTNVSDARFKKNIQENVPGLKFIKKLRPVTYNLDLNTISKHNKTPEKLRDFSAEKLKESQIQSGFIAQEVEQVAKELGYEFSGVDAPKNENDYYGLRYAEFVVPMVKAIQELEEENQRLKNQNQELEKRLKAIEEKLSK
jgi:trimeric autotransporter adhesin